MRFEDLYGRKVVIWGAGREGRAAYDELRRRQVPALFALTGDAAPPADLASVSTVGDAAVKRLLAAEVIIKSPGVPRTSAEFVRVRESDIRLTSLTDLWLSDNAARALAVTGTKGKSTTSAAIQHLLNSVGIPASLVGNGGTPVTDGDSADAHVAVAEVSSYQAADLSTSPRVVVVTSLYPEHLPWHGGYDQYIDDKLNLVAYDPEIVVVPDRDELVALNVRARVGSSTRLVNPSQLGIAVSPTGVEWNGVGRLTAEELALRGHHNRGNLTLALTATCVGFDLPEHRYPDLLAACRSIRPLSHRLETVPSDDGRQWVDDSLATAPEAVVAALETFPEIRVTLILGGADRGLSFDPLVEYMTRRRHGPVEVVAVGPAGGRWLEEGIPGARLAASFEQAMTWVRAEPDASEVVLLSPGAPSFDEFTDYRARSVAFRNAATSGRTAADAP